MYLNVSKAKVGSKRIKADSSTAGRGYNPISHDLMECWTGLDGLNGLLLPIHMFLSRIHVQMQVYQWHY